MISQDFPSESYDAWKLDTPPWYDEIYEIICRLCGEEVTEEGYDCVDEPLCAECYCDEETSSILET